MFVVLQRHAVVGSCYYIGLHHETVFLSLWCISHSSITVCNGCKLQNTVDDLQKRVSSSKDESKSIVWSSKVFLSMKVKSFEPVFIETDFSGRASQSLINWRQRYLPRMAFRELESKKAQDAENAPLLQSQRVTIPLLLGRLAIILDVQRNVDMLNIYSTVMQYSVLQYSRIYHPKCEPPYRVNCRFTLLTAN